MAPSLHPAAEAAAEAVRAFERTLNSTRSQWNDNTRRSFDQRNSEVILVKGRNIALELASIAQELDSALRLLD
jgi:hypothetical protein